MSINLFSFCSTSFNGNFLRIFPRIANFMNRRGQNVEVLGFFPKNKPASIQNQVLHFFQHGFSWLFWKLVKTYRNDTYCVWFLAAQLWVAAIAKNWIFVWFVWINKFGSFENAWLNFSHPGLNQYFCNCRASFNNNLLGNVFDIGKNEEQNGHQVWNISIFLEKQTFCSPKLSTAFRASWY